MSALLLLALACGSSGEPEASERPTGPDVIILSVDTLRHDRLGFAGHTGAHTPNLDALAAKGRVFTQATTPFPRTTPALASLQTGLWPHHHGSREVGQVMTAERTLAGELGGRDWHTVGISAMKVAGPEQALDRGFQRYLVDHDAPAHVLARQALAQVGDLEGQLYLWVHFSDPHFPYLPHEDGPMQPDAPGCRALGEGAAAGARRDAIFTDRGGVASSVLEECLALYDAEIAHVDAAIGELLAGLDAMGRKDRWVVVTADHGEHQGDRGLYFEHGPDVHDASLRVPLVVAGPEIPPGVDHGVARLEDVAPTVLGWAEVPADERPPMDGVDLGPRLLGGEGGPDLALAESGSALHLYLHDFLVSGRPKRFCVNSERFAWCTLGRKGSGLYDHVADPDLKRDISADHPEVVARLKKASTRWPPEQARSRTARDGRFKLVASPVLDGGYQLALHDLAADPDETIDVSAAHPEVRSRLEARLDAWVATLDPAPEVDREDDELEALRALGYVE